MRDDKDKKIGSATYLNKSNGKYIPFGVFMTGVYCPLIQSMLNKTEQKIYYKIKDNRI